jgi:tight adherence protein C
MSAAIILGSGLGAGLWALTVWLFPPRPALGALLQHATATTAPPTSSPTSPPASTITSNGSRRWVRLCQPLVTVLRACGLPTTVLLRDLAVLEKPADVFLTEKATWTLAGLLVPAGVATALGALTGGLALPVPVALAIAGAALGFLAPDLRVRRSAARRRADFRHALSAYLDLVVISLAGGAGVDSALHDPVAIGHGWAFHHLDRALTSARLTRTTPWVALRQLGRALDITELTELAASVSLAGTEGARVRASLATKAAALRGRALTDAETKAGADTERMSLPVVALFLGFLLFIAYPAVSQILTGL